MSENENNNRGLLQQIQDVADEFCTNYCKYPDIWDEEKEGCELSESDHCQNCPLNRL